MQDPIHFYSFLIINLAQMPTLLIMLAQLWGKYKGSADPGTGKRDPVRLLVLLQILFWFASIIPPTLYRLTTLEDPGSQFNTINPSSVAISCIIATGVMLLAYVHHKESWMYAAWFFYAGMIVYMLLTNNGETFFMLQFGFAIVGEVAFDLFYFITAFKYRDDKIMGLAIFFLVPIISGSASSNVIVYVACYGFLAIYGIPYAMGKIKFFKQKPVQLVEAEVRE